MRAKTLVISACLLATMIIGFLPPGTTAAQTGTISFSPSGYYSSYAYYVDGDLYGIASGSASVVVEAGQHDVRCIAPANADFTDTVTVAEGMTEYVSFTFTEQTGSVYLSVSPSTDYAYFIDGELMGTDWGSATIYVEAGTHNLKLMAQGYQPYSQQITVTPGGYDSVSATLLAENGDVTLDVSPSVDYAYFVDGELIGVEWATAYLTLPAGNREITIMAQGYLPHTETVAVAAGGSQTVYVTLTADYGSLSIDGPTDDYAYYIDGKLAGVGWGTTDLTLSPGDHELMFLAEGYLPHFENVTVIAGGSDSIIVTLAPDTPPSGSSELTLNFYNGTGGQMLSPLACAVLLNGTPYYVGSPYTSYATIYSLPSGNVTLDCDILADYGGTTRQFDRLTDSVDLSIASQSLGYNFSQSNGDIYYSLYDPDGAAMYPTVLVMTVDGAVSAVTEYASATVSKTEAAPGLHNVTLDIRATYNGTDRVFAQYAKAEAVAAGAVAERSPVFTPMHGDISKALYDPLGANLLSPSEIVVSLDNRPMMVSSYPGTSISLDNLPAGKHTLVVDAIATYNGTTRIFHNNESVTVVAGADSAQNMALRQVNGDIIITMVDQHGDPATGATAITINGAAAQVLSTQTTGTVTIYEHKPGSLKVSADIVEYRGANATKTLGAGKTVTFLLTLFSDRALVVAGASMDSETYQQGSYSAMVMASVTSRYGDAITYGIYVNATINGAGLTEPMSYSYAYDAYTATFTISSLAVGNYTVHVVAEAAGYAPGQNNATFQITPLPNQVPTASAGAFAITIRANAKFQLNGTGTDYDGTIVKYEWDFDGDGTWDYTSATTGIVNHSWGKVGVYNATFRVTDDRGDTDSDVVMVSVLPQINTGIDFGLMLGIIILIVIIVVVVLVLLLVMRKKPGQPQYVVQQVVVQQPAQGGQVITIPASAVQPATAAQPVAAQPAPAAPAAQPASAPAALPPAK